MWVMNHLQNQFGDQDPIGESQVWDPEPPTCLGKQNFGQATEWSRLAPGLSPQKNCLHMRSNWFVIVTGSNTVCIA